MVLKLSGLQCKGGASSAAATYSYKNRHPRNVRGSYTDVEDDAESDGGSHYAYLRAGSSISTPAWDFTTVRPGGIADDVVIEESNGEPKEWTALVEPGVQITFVSFPGGAGNDLKRIRFRYSSVLVKY